LVSGNLVIGRERGILLGTLDQRVVCKFPAEGARSLVGILVKFCDLEGYCFGEFSVVFYGNFFIEKSASEVDADHV
jgi:hypothetical protein